jgi:hypothetical protein
MSLEVSSDALGRGDAPALPSDPSARRTAWLAWALLALALLIAIPADLLATINKSSSLADNTLSAVFLMVFAGMGALIASRRPRNPVGWLLCLVALLSLTGELTLEYAYYGLVRHPGALPAAIWVVPIGGAARSVGWFYMLTLVPLYFPTGKLLSPRWRWVEWVVAAATVSALAGAALSPFGDFTDLQLASIHNPLAIVPVAVGDFLGESASFVMFLLVPVCTYSMVLRFRRSQGIERQQLKWFVYAMAIGLMGSIGLFAVVFFSVNVNPSTSLWTLVTVGMPIAAGIAILRYRLYDIDIIIKRTLVYGSLTAILAALYFALVIGAQTLTKLVTGQQVGQQPVVIVLSTLLIAALFQPLRARLQRWMDRRFYRSRYNAAKTLAAFSATLRSELDPDELRGRLLGVVEETMRPTHVSLWLRTAPSKAHTPADGANDAR